MSSVSIGGGGGSSGSTPGPQGDSAYQVWLNEGNVGTEQDFLTDISAGADGKTILSGTVVPTTEGVNGDFYLRTSTSDLYGPKTAGDWGTATSLLGSDGSDGKTLLNGTVVPTTEGVNGDFYIRTSTNELYGPKTAGDWGTATSLVGPTGNGTPVEVVSDFPGTPTVGTLYIKVL